MANTLKFGLIVAGVAVLSTGFILFTPQKTGSDPESDSPSLAEETAGTVLGAGSESREGAEEIENNLKKIDIAKAKELIAIERDNPSFKIIDIRTKEEYGAGNIGGAINIDFYSDFETEIAKLDPNGKYLIYCRSGNRSSQASQIFKKLLFKEVYDLEGGYNAWLSS